MASARTVRVRAHAKINLTLHVRGVRADGYHELETVFQALALHDTVTCVARPGAFAIRCDDPGVPTDDRNLVWRAAQALWRAAGRRGRARDVDVSLAKQIPMQSGLGGGSSDAAAALEALARLWKIEGDVDLSAVAAAIGSDVPYFLTGGTALGLSRGERLYTLPELPSCHVVLGFPAFGVSTAEAYRWFDADARRRPAGAGLVPATVGWPDRWLVVHNDLEAPVVRRHPEIGAIRELLAEGGASAASMTGSGSAVFGLFDTAARARRAARAVAEAGFVAILTETAGRG